MAIIASYKPDRLVLRAGVDDFPRHLTGGINDWRLSDRNGYGYACRFGSLDIDEIIDNIRHLIVDLPGNFDGVQTLLRPADIQLGLGSLNIEGAGIVLRRGGIGLRRCSLCFQCLCCLFRLGSRPLGLLDSSLQGATRAT